MRDIAKPTAREVKVLSRHGGLRHGHAHVRAHPAGLRAIHHHRVAFGHGFAGGGARVTHLRAKGAHFHAHRGLAHHEVGAHLAHLSAIHHHLPGGAVTARVHALHLHLCTHLVTIHAGLDAVTHLFRHRIGHHHWNFSPSVRQGSALGRHTTIQSQSSANCKRKLLILNNLTHTKEVGVRADWLLP